MCPGSPAHLKNVQLRCKCSIRLSGAESTKQAIKWACTWPREAPSKAPFKLQHLHQSALPCLKGRSWCSYRKFGFFFFALKYQNYKKSVYKLFFQNNHQNKTIPQIKILSKVLITLLLTLKPSTHSHVMGKRKGACSWWPPSQKVPKRSNGFLFENHGVGNSCSDHPPLLSRPRGTISDWARRALWILRCIFDSSCLESPQLSQLTVLWVCDYFCNKLCKSEPF